MTATIAPADLREPLHADAVTVIDVRPLRFYNGWRQGDDARGGHIPGAVAFPAEWLDSVDAPEVARLIDEKGLRGDRPVVVYGTGVADAERFADHLRSIGVREVCTLEGGFAGWAADPEAHVDRLPRDQHLVHGDWLSELRAGGRPEAAPPGRYLLFHVNFGVPEEYAEGRVPGALYLDTNALEDPADWNRRSPAEIQSAIASLGITRDTTVILYGRDTEGDANEKWPGRRAGQIAATRALMILRYAGIDDLRLLDGGYDWWVRAGHPLETTPREPTPVADIGVTVPLRPEVIVDLFEAKQILADPDGAALVSVRTWREHIGNLSGYDYLGPAGRIKGDVWGNCGTDAFHMQHYRNVDNTMRAYPEIAANWAEAGITADKWVAFYCGTGWRASEAWFYAFLQGWDRIAVYDGGWFEWSKDPVANPIEIGEPAVAGEAVA
ncbi:rhodanese-like domain-containing protein [soil metagenome]